MPRAPRLSRTLLLLRHARPEPPSADVEDAARPLALAGRRDAVHIGRRMAVRGLVPDFVVSSPALRAEETTMRLLDAWKREDAADDPEACAWPDAAYGASLADLLQILADVPAAHRRVLVVAHNPGLGELLRHLVGATAAPGAAAARPFGQGTLAVVRMPRDWSDLPPGSAELEAMFDPDAI